jgi:heterodisulfide reductase subunit B
MSYAYYPGCSLRGSGVAYGLSVETVARLVGLELREIEDWNCCGATEYHTVDELTAQALVARNLALVDAAEDQLVAPCSMCYQNLKKTDHLMASDLQFEVRINEALGAGGLHYRSGRLRIRHFLDVLYHDVGREAIVRRLRRPLRSLRVAPYHGCMIARPLDGFDDPEYPVKLDELLGWLGAEVVDYPLKTRCCGGYMTQLGEARALDPIRQLLQLAHDARADLVACLCPACQLNLDVHQGRVNAFFGTAFAIPVVFFTQLVGFALGASAKALGLGKEVVPASRLLASLPAGSSRSRGEARDG